MNVELGQKSSTLFRLVLAVATGLASFVVVDTLSMGLFSAIAFGIGALIAWLIARR